RLVVVRLTLGDDRAGLAEGRDQRVDHFAGHAKRFLRVPAHVRAERQLFEPNVAFDAWFNADAHRFARINRIGDGGERLLGFTGNDGVWLVAAHRERLDFQPGQTHKTVTPVHQPKVRIS